jgi:predicted aldo/keto reductase-like oxidoreductase
MSLISKRIKLGKTELEAGRLGISSSFGSPAAAFEMAFEHGCNYFTWGTFIRGRSTEMKIAIQNIINSGKRDELILSMFSYAHSAFLTEKFFLKGLRELQTPFADILLLGYFPSKPPRRILDGALNLKKRGLVRYIGISGHNRKLFPKLLEDGIIDIFHLRYNAANRGAEQDIFPFLPEKKSCPGIVSFTATRNKHLINPEKIPPGEKVPSAQDCYRFVLSNPYVDICMTGARNLSQMEENLKVLEMNTMNEQEMAWMHKIGDYVHRR